MHQNKPPRSRTSRARGEGARAWEERGLDHKERGLGPWLCPPLPTRTHLNIERLQVPSLDSINCSLDTVWILDTDHVAQFG